MNIKRDFIQRVKACGVLKIAEQYTAMRQVNQDTWMGRCPNPKHRDTTASFMVKRNRDGPESWACFGCHAGPKDDSNNGSDNIAFMQWIYDVKYGQKLSFLESLEITADFFGMEMEREPEKYSGLYEANESKCRAFQRNLNPGVISYLMSRGLDASDIEKWKLGYDGERVTFPVFNAYGQIAGFSCRILPGSDDERKYKNSKESPVFRKREMFYGLNFIPGGEKRLLIAEGQMDAILAQKYGVSFAVSTMSCSLSDAHIDYIARNDRIPILCYDGDTAGKGGIAKALDRLAAADVKNTKVIMLPDGKDLADIANDIKTGLPKYIESNMMAYSQYILKGLADELDITMNNKLMEIMPKIRKALASTSDPDEAALAKNFIDKRLRLWVA